MGIQNQALLALASVKAYRGYAVVCGVVRVTNDELVAHLDATYAEVTVVGLTVKPGGALLQLSPGIFETIRLEYVEELQHSLQGQLAAQNDVDVEFHE